MHEAGLARDLVRKADAVVAADGAQHAVAVTVRAGALSHLSARHLRAHFGAASEGTRLEGAELTVLADDEPTAADAMDLVLVSVDTVVAD